MPRFLPDCFERLAATDTGGEPSSVIARYLVQSGRWHSLGLEVPARDVRCAGAELWRSRPDLRPVLAPHVLYTVCDEYRRAFRRAAETHDLLDYQSWLTAYPDLAAAIEPLVVRRARRFQQTQIALRACMVWGRHLEGGEEAWQQLANAVRWGRRNADLSIEPDVRRELTLSEVARVNVHLADNEHLKPVERYRDDSDLGRSLQDVILASREVAEFLGCTWSEEDDLRFAATLRRLPAPAQRRFRTKRCTAPLQKIAELASQQTPRT